MEVPKFDISPFSYKFSVASRKLAIVTVIRSNLTVTVVLSRQNVLTNYNKYLNNREFYEFLNHKS